MWIGTGELTDAVHRLGAFAAEITLAEVDDRTRAAAELLVLDTVGVTVAGARTGELSSLVAAMDPPHGPARLLGTDRDATVDSAALLNGTAACALELDEGSKHARGHPSAHVLPAVLALGAA
ncbi:MAG: MmgE/PrpD family protein, partial [Actinomycetota bacterium]